MNGFCDLAWQRTAGLRNAIHSLPFNQELAAGILAEARFQFYIEQDALYLDQYARTLAMAGHAGRTTRLCVCSPNRRWKR